MNQEKKDKVYPWNNVAVFGTYQEAYQKRYEILNEDVTARLQTKISKQAKGFVVKTRVKPGVQEKETNKKKKKTSS